MTKTIVAVCSLALMSFAAQARSSQEKNPAGFALKSGDTVVLYGDSITAQTLYTQDIELYTATRFPTSRIHFITSGVGGDKVSGGYGGSADVRLARDVFAYHPNMVTIMLGMNDGSYAASSDATETAYLSGYQHLLESIQGHVPGVRLTLLGPSAYDDVTRSAWIPGGYNGVLQHYADLDRQLAGTYRATFINLNPPVVSLLQKAQTLDPLLAQQLIPDRIHPSATVHWVMAEAVLKGWNAPALVSSVTIDAAGERVVESRNATVDAFGVNKDNLNWSETEAALPLPFNEKNAADSLLMQLTDIERQLNQEPLRITGLKLGYYKLTIDDKTVGIFTAAELEASVNLALYPTPMRDQAQNVAYKVSDHVETRRTDLRFAINGVDPATLNAIERAEAEDEAKVFETAIPRPHRYRLVRVDAQP